MLAEYETFINVDFVEKSGGGDIGLYFGRTNLGSLDGLGGINWKKTSTSSTSTATRCSTPRCR